MLFRYHPTLLATLAALVGASDGYALKPELTVMVHPHRLANIIAAQASPASPVVAKYNAKMVPMFDDVHVNETLAKYYVVTGAKEDDFKVLVSELRAHDDIQTAYITPASVTPILFTSNGNGSAVNSSKRDTALLNDSPSLRPRQSRTPLFTGEQRYLRNGVSGGLNVDFAQNLLGGYGENIQVFDVEYGWNDFHEDLQVNFPSIIGGLNDTSTNVNYRENRAHGAAVAGVIGGDLNSFGINGIAPSATFIASSVYSTDSALEEGIVSVARAIRACFTRARAGDVILLEQQRPWDPLQPPPINPADPNSRPPSPLIPIEWWPQDFDAIREAVNRGVIVVEAAGNGDFDLDSPALATSRLIPPPGSPDDVDTNPFGNIVTHPNPFTLLNPSTSSGAILVGSGASPLNGRVDRQRLPGSNYGARLDVQAWGEMVLTTTAYVPASNLTFICDRFGNSDSNCYTKSFSGTSSASAIIAGIIASTQGILKASGRRLLTGPEYIRLFRDPTALWPQTAGIDTLITQRVGSRPDMSQLVPMAIALANLPPIPL